MKIEISYKSKCHVSHCQFVNTKYINFPFFFLSFSQEPNKKLNKIVIFPFHSLSPNIFLSNQTPTQDSKTQYHIVWHPKSKLLRKIKLHKIQMPHFTRDPNKKLNKWSNFPFPSLSSHIFWLTKHDPLFKTSKATLFFFLFDWPCGSSCLRCNPDS